MNLILQCFLEEKKRLEIAFLNAKISHRQNNLRSPEKATIILWQRKRNVPIDAAWVVLGI